MGSLALIFLVGVLLYLMRPQKGPDDWDVDDFCVPEKVAESDQDSP